MLTSTRASGDAARRLAEWGQTCEKRDLSRYHPVFLCRRSGPVADGVLAQREDS